MRDGGPGGGAGDVMGTGARRDCWQRAPHGSRRGGMGQRGSGQRRLLALLRLPLLLLPLLLPPLLPPPAGECRGAGGAGVCACNGCGAHMRRGTGTSTRWGAGVHMNGAWGA